MNYESELVLVLAPTDNDSEVAAQVLRDSGLLAVKCKDVSDLCQQMNDGAAVIVIAEEALPLNELPLLKFALEAQETWSDIPVILLVGQGPFKNWDAFSKIGNVSILERPFSRLTFTRAAQVGIRARLKQYEVRKLIEEQKQAAQKRDEFFASLSHELRTPLNVILGWTELLQSGELSQEEQADAIMVLERNGKMQKSLIDDLLDTSRIINGKLHFEALPVSLRMLVHSAQKSFTPRAEEKNIIITLDLPEEDCLVLADEQRLSQVISNLLTNAIKFTEAFGSIQIKLHQKSNNYVVSVKDSGQGIEPSFLPFVFDRLKQEDMSTTRSHGGLGLGLAIVSHIVEQHNGHIQVFSDGRGKGSEFVLTIPALPGQVKILAQPEKLFHIDDSLHGIRVLVVDDSPDILELISIWLKKAHADFKLTHSAAEALAELPKFKPDVLLSDIGMPEMDGYELIRRVRSSTEPSVRDVQAVALTAYAKDEERTKALQAGFQMHISKPISNDQLVSAISLLVRPSAMIATALKN